MRDFTLCCYEELCKALLNTYKPISVSDYILKKGKSDRAVVIRHDVDRNISNAVEMAILEQNLGIQSTYYFRYPRTFNKKYMDIIAQAGHEIGYHYECLSKQKNNVESAIKIFNKELKIFRSNGYNITSVCPHGGSLFYSNHGLLSNVNFSDHGIVGEAYCTLLCNKNLFYASDTGRTWGPAPFKSTSVLKNMNIKSTHDIIEFLINYQSDVYLLVHPERWVSNNIKYYKSIIFDTIVNNYKKLYASIN